MPAAYRTRRGTTFILVKVLWDSSVRILSCPEVYPGAVLLAGVSYEHLYRSHGRKSKPAWPWAFSDRRFYFQTMGLQYTSASNAAFITGLSVVIVPIIFRFIPPVALLGYNRYRPGNHRPFLLSVTDAFYISYGDILVLVQPSALPLI